jgi:hypothetical protein
MSKLIENGQNQPTALGRFEFYFQSIDTMVLVENLPDGIVIRTTEDTFSTQRKEYFIRELAREGFIPERYIWSSAWEQNVQWVLDQSWLKTKQSHVKHTRRFIFRVTIVGVVLLALFFVAYSSDAPLEHRYTRFASPHSIH